VRFSFVSHDDELDLWFREGEWLAPGGEVTHCYVWCSRGYDEVDGFYTLTAHRLARHGRTDRGERSVIGLRLNRLASGRRDPDVDLEALLLRDAIERAMGAARAGAAEFLAVRPESHAHAQTLRRSGLWEVPGSDVFLHGLATGSSATPASAGS